MFLLRFDGRSNAGAGAPALGSPSAKLAGTSNPSAPTVNVAVPLALKNSRLRPGEGQLSPPQVTQLQGAIARSAPGARKPVAGAPICPLATRGSGVASALARSSKSRAAAAAITPGPQATVI